MSLLDFLGSFSLLFICDEECFLPLLSELKTKIYRWSLTELQKPGCLICDNLNENPLWYSETNLALVNRFEFGPVFIYLILANGSIFIKNKQTLFIDFENRLFLILLARMH